MGEEQEPLLKVRELKKYFDVSEKGIFKKEKKLLRAVDNLNFDVCEGETFGIVGESGCGKSTLGKMITQLIEPTEGIIDFDGKDLNSLSEKKLREKRKDFQMIFQDPSSSLNPRMRTFDIIAEPLLNHNVSTNNKDLNNRVLELMETVGLQKQHAYRYPHEFSGGQKQRIGIARALALNPKLIICDEPVSALDVSIQSQILNLLKELQNKFSLTYIFIAHGFPAVKYISDRIAVMYLGKIVELGTKNQIFNNTKHPYTAGLLSSIPIPDPEMRAQKKRIVLKGETPNPVNPPSGCYFHPRCPFATEICKNEQPPFEEHEKGHFFACHNPLITKGDELLNV